MADTSLKDIAEGFTSLFKVGGDLAAIGLQIAKSIDSTQKSALAFGTSVENTSKSFKESIESLNGGFLVRVESVLDILSTGLETNSTGLIQLVNSQKITNQDSKKTAKAFANMTAALGLNDEQLDDMSESLMESSKEYRVSTSRLVDTFGSLERTLGTQALLDMGPELNMAVTKLVSEMPEAQKQINSFASLILDKSQRGIEQRIMLGITEDAMRIRAAETEEEARLSFISAITKVNDFGSQFNFTKDDLLTLGNLTELFGQGFEDAVIITKNMGKREKTAVEDRVNFEESLSTQLGNAFFTLQRQLIDTIAGPVLDIITSIGTAMSDPDGNFSKLMSTLSNAVSVTIDKILAFDYTEIIKIISEAVQGPAGLFSALSGSSSIFESVKNAFLGNPTTPSGEPQDKLTPDGDSNIPLALSSEDTDVSPAGFFASVLEGINMIEEHTRLFVPGVTEAITENKPKPIEEETVPEG